MLLRKIRLRRQGKRLSTSRLGQQGIVESQMCRHSRCSSVARHDSQIVQNGCSRYVARDEARLDSDVDILAEFERPVGYFILVRLGAYLEQILEHRVDLVTPGALTDRLREEIRREAVRAA